MIHVLFDSTATGHLRLTYDTAAEAYTASLSDGVSTVTIVVLAATLPAEDGRFALRYDADLFELLFNGRSLGSVPTPPLPVLAGSLSLGSDAAGNQWDDIVGGVRVSSRVRSDAELAAALLRIDAESLAYLPWIDSLASGYPYFAYPFTLTLPDDRDDQINTSQLAIDNVDRSIVKTIRSLTSPPTVAVKIVLASTPDVIEAGPIPFTLTGARWDALTVEGDLGFVDELLGQGYPAHAMTPQLFPGIFA